MIMIFTVSSYVLIPVVLMRDIYSIIVCIDSGALTEGYLQYHGMHNTCGLTEGYLQYHCIY
jgi:hypothetical protein